MCSDTYTNEKSRRASADQSTSAATSVETNDASSAFCAESARRRRRFQAAYEPPTSAYTTRPRLRRSAARPSPATLRRALGRLVLRGALRRERALVRDEGPVAEHTGHDDLAPDLEEVGDAAVVGDASTRRGVTGDVAQDEAKAFR